MKEFTGNVLAELAEEYPQLYLDPDKDTQESYRQIVLQGEEPEEKDLSHYCTSPNDRMETAQTPAGPVRVVTLGNRRDFELVLRGLMAAKDGPLEPVPETTGASMLTLFNWPRIKAHLSVYPEEEQAEEFRRFTSVKENYVDMLVVLSRGPYSHVDAAAIGHSPEEWLDYSDSIRRYHELTHVICRRLYPDKINAVRDELVADAIGLYAAYGKYEPRKAELFLGLDQNKYIGGRLENYTDDPEGLAGPVSIMIRDLQDLIEKNPVENPFDLIPVIMDEYQVNE